MAKKTIAKEQLRLIRDQPASGSWNMSVDQALLAAADDTGQITLRWYRWQEPTLSLGYFQKAADREHHDSSLNCPLVRRASGGGAIVHDQELTYSLCIPSKSRWSKKNSELYTKFHESITEALGKNKINADLYNDDDRNSAGDKNAFLCFERRTSGDIVLANQKICGSAQRRLKNAVLQHGSILISKSIAAPELPGIENLCDETIDTGDLMSDVTNSIARWLSLEIVESPLTNSEIESAREIKKKKFGNNQWTLNR